MFWRFGGYANISTIDTILDKPDFSLEELLDEGDLIQELKQHNSKLIEYLREDKILEKLLEYVVAPKLEVFSTPDDTVDNEPRGKSRLLSFSRPRASSRSTDVSENDEEEQEKKRNRYALVASEVLSSDTWSIYEALTENRELIRKFWQFLERPAPLDPLQASYFTKVNESLFEKKTDDMMDLFRTVPNVVSELLKHVECPMIMDLLLKIVALDRHNWGEGIVEWLYSKDIIPTLLSCLDPKHSWVVQTAAGDFIKAIITISANASQNEQQCIGPNELTRQLVSQPCVEQLIGYMLGGGNPLTVGVGIVIEVIRKNNSDYDPDIGSGASPIPSSRDPIYLGTLLRLFALNVPKFMSLIMDGPARKGGLESTFGDKLEPLGFDRFKTCELMAELLHCSNMGLLNEVGSEQLIATRDAERHRLRGEGKLVPVREENPSTEDLTMRMSHGTHEEGRRLEVTNADDDGFEEVEPSNDLGEDTSHEFVNAEDDIAGADPPSSFLEKDEDDFVDEPLSSPRLTLGTDKINEQRFDEAESLVSPLSPSKEKSPEASRPEEPNVPEDVDEHVNPSDHLTDNPSDSHTVSEPEPPSASTDPGESQDINQAGNLTPHPDDTPAPLFSSLSSSTSLGTAPSAVAHASQPTQTGTAAVPLSFQPGTDGETLKGAESADVSQLASEPSQTEAVSLTEPVVGDYLKMQFVEHRVVPAILSFFFAYPWNNFLHNVVYDIVQQVFNGPMDRGYNPTLAVSLFEAADITTAIINGQQASDESQAKTKTRMGYMGHLTLIAEEVVKFTERHPPELLSETVLDRVMSQDWINYVEGALAQTRERDNAILGGVRPEVALGHRSSIGGGSGSGGVGLSGLGGASSAGSNALAEAGLNGSIELNESSNNGIGPFAFSAGTLMSGFGSSSDEEEDEGDVEEEDVNSEFRNYADPLNNANASMTPPSIPPPPPPPPPLNTPPSRARLQLAARLAMHQKNSQSAQPSSAALHSDGGQADDNTVDPFRDGDDDDDDDVVEDDEVEDDDDLDVSDARDGGRGSWWRSMVGSKGNGASSGDENDDENESDEAEEDEFGDFETPEDEKGNGLEETVDLPGPVVSNAFARENSRTLSGLWPFASRNDTKAKGEDGGEASTDNASSSADEKMMTEDRSSAVEVKEAMSRTSIEEPDDDEAVAVDAGSQKA